MSIHKIGGAARRRYGATKVCALFATNWVLGFTLFVLIFAYLAVPASAQKSSTSISTTTTAVSSVENDSLDLLFVLDVSGSMDDYVEEGYKLDLAIDALNETFQNYTVAGGSAQVLAYSGECAPYWNSNYAVPNLLNEWLIADWPAEKNNLSANGGTPTDAALVTALNRLGYLDLNGNLTGSGTGTIILISDGASNYTQGDSDCRNPCEVVESVSDAVTVHTVGFTIAGDEYALAELSCIADTTGGVALSVEEAEELNEVLEELIALNVSLKLDVQAVGDTLIVNLILTNTSPKVLNNAKLRIEGPPELMGTEIENFDLQTLKPYISDTTLLYWNANICENLDESVVFTVTGTVTNNRGEIENKKLVPQIRAAGDLLQIAEGEEGIYDRCSRDYSSTIGRTSNLTDQENPGSGNPLLNIIPSVRDLTTTILPISLLSWVYISPYAKRLNSRVRERRRKRRRKRRNESEETLNRLSKLSNLNNFEYIKNKYPRSAKFAKGLGITGTAFGFGYEAYYCIEMDGSNFSKAGCVTEEVLEVICVMGASALGTPFGGLGALATGFLGSIACEPIIGGGVNAVETGVDIITKGWDIITFWN